MDRQPPSLEPEALSRERQKGLHYDQLHVPVRAYVDNLRAQIYEVLKKYDVTNMTEFIAKTKHVKVDDRKRVKRLLEAMVAAYKTNQTPEYRAEFEAIREQEAESLERFFEKKIDIPPLPHEITLDQIIIWESEGLTLHYLPDEDMKENKHLKNWKKQPDYEKHLDVSKLPPDIMILKGGWVLVDTRKKPEYLKGEQMYDKDSQGQEIEDILGTVLEDLRRKKIIQEFKYPQSRFNLSLEELEKPEVIAAFAQAYGVKTEQITVQHEIEFNVLGNLYHPEWGKPPSSCYEWFSDRYDTNQMLLAGGGSNDGGLSYVDWCNPGHNNERIGFRLIVRFPENQAA